MPTSKRLGIVLVAIGGLVLANIVTHGAVTPALFVLAIPGLFVAGLIATIAGERSLRRQGHRWRLPHVRSSSHTFGPDARRFRGGARVGMWNASIPLATLTVDHSWAAIRGLVPSVWIERSKVSAVREISVPLGPGIRFDSEEGLFDGAIFWSFSRETVLHELRALGWPVS